MDLQRVSISGRSASVAGPSVGSRPAASSRELARACTTQSRQSAAVAFQPSQREMIVDDEYEN